MRISTRIFLFVFVALAYGPAQGLADPILGADLATFAVLGATEVTNVSPSVIVGNLGVSPGTSITGFSTPNPGLTNTDPQVTGGGTGAGDIHWTTTTGFPNAASAQAQLTTARLNLAGLGAGTLLPVDLVGLTIFPGVYTVPAGTTNLSGAVTLDGQGNANAFWLFQTGAFTTASASVVNVINTGTGAGVFWNDTSSVTLGSSTSFQGNILALTSIVFDSTAKIGCGRALADTGDVTLIMNTIGIDCGAGTGGVLGSNGFSGNGLEFTGGVSGVGGEVRIAAGLPGAGTLLSVPGTFVPEPATLALLGIAFAGMGLARRRKLS